MSASRSASASGEAAGRSSFANFQASRVIGVWRGWRTSAASATEALVPGVQVIGTQKSPASGMPKLRSSGTTPASTSDDLPEPEPPITATNCVSCSRAITSRTWCSRPSSSDDSWLRNGRRPG